MAEKVKVVYVASDDPSFGKIEDTAILLTNDVVIDNNYGEGEAVIFVLDNPVEPGEVLTIDRYKTKRFEVNFFGMNDVVDFDSLKKCTFTDLVKCFAK